MKKILRGILFWGILVSLTSCTIMRTVNTPTNQSSQNLPNSTVEQSSTKEFEPIIELVSIERETSQQGYVYPLPYFKFKINFENIYQGTLEIETGSGVNLVIKINGLRNNDSIGDFSHKYDFSGVKSAKLTNVVYGYRPNQNSLSKVISIDRIDIIINSSLKPNSSAKGSSSNSNIVKISTVSDFKNIKEDNSIYELQNDIDFKNQAVQLKINFNGTFKGNGYKLKNINNNLCNFSSNNHVMYSAIFDNINKGAVVKDLELFNCNSSISNSINSYSSILCSGNYGTISNVILKESDITTNISTADGSQGALATFNYGEIVNVTLDDVDLSCDGCLTSVGGIVFKNDGKISNSVIFNSSVYGNNAGQVVSNNAGIIENVAVINCDVTVPTKNISAGCLGGIAAINNKTIKNSYLFDTDLHLIINSKTPLYLNIGGIAGANKTGGVINKCYYMGNINIPTKQQFISYYGFPKQIGSLIRINAGGICGNDDDKLESNFSDCKITGFANKSLTVPTLGNPIYRDILSVGIKRQGETRLISDEYDSNMTHDETYANTIRYDASTRQYIIKYYTDNNGSISSTPNETNWIDFLKVKKSIVNNSSNSGLVIDSTTKFYPYIKDNIGYNSANSFMDYQSIVKIRDLRAV